MALQDWILEPLVPSNQVKKKPLFWHTEFYSFNPLTLIALFFLANLVSQHPQVLHPFSLHHAQLYLGDLMCVSLSVFATSPSGQL